MQTPCCEDFSESAAKQHVVIDWIQGGECVSAYEPRLH